MVTPTPNPPVQFFSLRSEAAELLFDWKRDVERLERDALLAVLCRQPNEFALVDAECSEDLIPADLCAASHRLGHSRTTGATIEQLELYARRIGHVIQQLREVERSHSLA